MVAKLTGAIDMPKLLVMGDARSVHIERWCRYFEAEGYETALFSLEPKTISWPGRFYPGRRRTGIGLIDYALAKKDFKAALDDFSPDLINAHFVASYGWLASFCRGCPVVVTAWGSDLLILPQKSWLYRRRVARALEHAAYCTVDNNNLKTAAEKYAESGKIIRTVMGVDRRFFDSVSPPAFSERGPLRIISPRGLQPVYDPLTIVAGAGILRDKIEFGIDLLGNQPESDEILSEIQSRSLSDRVAVKPLMAHDQFALSLKNYDIYLSASLSDSTSVALLEAMTVGLFPVVSDIEGNREWIEDGVNGITFQPGSAESLAEAIIKAAAIRNRFGAVAGINREKVERGAIWQDSMNRLKEVFAGLSDHE